jgi:lincosamide nucleotidyltransferase B/F
MSREGLLQRLDAIGRSLEGTGNALALLALGSVGTELDRIDAYSDLDFFVVVRDGYRQAYLGDLGWLSSVHPIAYCFLNTLDGYKVLFEDGIYAEFAVFTMAELAQIEFPEGRIVWKAAGVDDAIRFPQRGTGPGAGHTLEWLIGEALTNLYVGLGRYNRGERLSALRLIQVHAVDRILELAQRVEAEQLGPATHRDAFAAERRFEQRFPTVVRELPRFMQGYDRSPESAATILAFLERHWEVNLAIAQAIRGLLPAHLVAPGEGEGNRKGGQ